MWHFFFLTLALTVPLIAFAQFVVPEGPKFAGGDGRSCATAVVLLVDTSAKAIEAENEWLKQRFFGGKKVSQALARNREKTKTYDEITWEKADGSEVTICFDI